MQRVSPSAPDTSVVPWNNLGQNLSLQDSLQPSTVIAFMPLTVL
ncbi:hypothetical protein [Leptolyngbya ectocarpi]|nr:hypothetical protein [Leptolyngbya ectocarpi]